MWPDIVHAQQPLLGPHSWTRKMISLEQLLVMGPDRWPVLYPEFCLERGNDPLGCSFFLVPARVLTGGAQTITCQEVLAYL